MLNLLIISDSPKAEYVKGVLQPLLKVVIDVVTDFDHGLKDVFEKRPATVCIQDQIGGVTGESVARHIQMLLGNSAPSFILLHTGNDKARAITGLYEHIVDLNQPNEALTANVINILKALLGDQWEKIYILSKQSPASVRPSVAVPEESREDADKLVDDFLSDLKMSTFPIAEDQLPVIPSADKVSVELSGVAPSVIPDKPEIVPVTVDSDRARSISDDLAEVKKAGQDKHRAKASFVVGVGPGVDFIESATGTVEQPLITASVPPPAAEFSISQNQLPPDDLSGVLLQAFEKNYCPDSSSFRRIAAVVLVSVVCATVGWYLFMQKPQMPGSLKQRFLPSSSAKHASVEQPIAAPAQMPTSAPVSQPVVTSPPLPAFIPADGHDRSYSVKNPGWERYIGKLYEFRIFSSSGRIQAVQVLGVKGAPVSEQLIKSVLQELAGSSQYQIASRSIKAGVNVESGTIQNKGEIVIYKKGGYVQAFVVSVN